MSKIIPCLVISLLGIYATIFLFLKELKVRILLAVMNDLVIILIQFAVKVENIFNIIINISVLFIIINNSTNDHAVVVTNFKINIFTF